MTILDPKPRWSAQAVMMRARSLPKEKTLVVVEGTSDRQSIVPFFADSVHVAAAGGRPGVLDARKRCEIEQIKNCLFLIDCDGLTSSEWLGHRNLIVSTNRDLEADFHLVLESFDRLGLQYLSKDIESVNDLRITVDHLSSYILQMTSRFGIVMDAARGAGCGVRIVDDRGIRRRIRFGDIDTSPEWARLGAFVTEEELAKEVSKVLGWSELELNSVLRFMSVARTKLCRAHGLPDCRPCIARRFCNGHDLVEFTALAMRGHLQRDLPHHEVSASLRMGADTSKLQAWDVMRRITQWESEAGRELLSRSTRTSLRIDQDA